MFECCMSMIRATVPSLTPPPQHSPVCVYVCVRECGLTLWKSASMCFVSCTSLSSNCLFHHDTTIIWLFTLSSSWKLIGSLVKHIPKHSTLNIILIFWSLKTKMMCFKKTPDSQCCPIEMCHDVCSQQTPTEEISSNKKCRWWIL